MMKRTTLLMFLLWLLIGARPALPEEPAPAPEKPEEQAQLPPVRALSPAGVRAIERGLEWLSAHQLEDGSWSANIGFKLNEGYQVEVVKTPHPGVTALAGMAFLAGGHIPGRGKYGRNVERAVEYILSCVRSDGMITANKSRMYSHAFGALFLAEVYGMTRDTQLKKGLSKSIQFTWQSQNRQGGWRYAPYAEDSDMSITVCQVMALRAARNAGIHVPRESIDRAVNYVLESANTSTGQEPGSFMYQFRTMDPIPTRSTFPLTAAGLATLYSAGLYSNEDILAHVKKHKIDRFRSEPIPRIDPILVYLRNHYASTRKNHYFFYYGNYYAAQAMFIAGGKWWDEYFRRVQGDLVEEQRADGSWPIAWVGDTYATASACLILQVPYQYLPIFQR